jgi:hypothetical protein
MHERGKAVEVGLIVSQASQKKNYVINFFEN